MLAIILEIELQETNLSGLLDLKYLGRSGEKYKKHFIYLDIAGKKIPLSMNAERFLVEYLSPTLERGLKNPIPGLRKGGRGVRGLRVI